MKTVKKINKVISATVGVLLCFTLLTNTLWGQDLLWKANFTGAGNNYPSKSVIDSQNNIYVIGGFDTKCDSTSVINTKGGKDIFITKYDATGKLKWVRQIGGKKDDVATGIAVSSDGNYVYITGSFKDSTLYADNLSISNTGKMDGFLAKYTKDGQIKKLVNIAKAAVSTDQRPNEIKIDTDGNLVIGGNFTSAIQLHGLSRDTTLITSQPLGMFVAKFDTAGNVIKAMKFDVSNNNSSLYTLDLDNTGYYLCGTFTGNLIIKSGIKSSKNTLGDVFIYKVNSNLDSLGIIQIGGTGDDELFSCSADNNGNFYIGGIFKSTSLTIDSTFSGTPSKRTIQNKGLYDIFFAKYSSSGVLQWFNTVGSAGDDYLYRALYNNGNFIVAGKYGDTLTFNNQTIKPKGNGDAFAIVHDNNDNLKYLIPITGTGSDIGETAVVDNNGNFVVIGDYTSPKIYFGNNKDSLTNSNYGTKDMFIAKYDKGSLMKVVTPITCAGSSTGIIDITPMGTVVAPFTYAWSKRENPSFSANTEDLNGVSAGTYRVTFTDALGYTKTDSVTLTDPAPLKIKISGKTDATCFNKDNGTIDITPEGGTPDYTYLWSSTTSGTGLNNTSQDQTGLIAGIYSVTVSDKNHCSKDTTNIIINQPDKIVFTGTTLVDIGITPPTPGSINLVVNGGTPVYTYTWTYPSGSTSFVQNLPNINEPGVYKVHVVDSNSCTGDTSIWVIDGLLSADIQGTNVSCYGGNNGSATVGVRNVLGTISYVWDDDYSSTTPTINNLTARTYHVTLTDDGLPAGSNQSVASIVITQPDLLKINSLTKKDIGCYDSPGDGSLNATITGGTKAYTYRWTKDGIDFATTEDLSSLTEGVYALTVTDALGCIVSGNSDTIFRPVPLSVSGTVKNVTCEGSKNDGAITLDVTGGWVPYTYAWNNGLTSQNITLQSAHDYTVIVTDSRNCKATLTQYIDYESPMSITFNVNDVLCKGSSTGNTGTLISGGHAPLSYQWSNGTTNSGITNVLAGSYTVTITDNKLCTKVKSVSIAEPSKALDIIKGSSGDVICNGGSDGFINISGTGGTPSYRYLWSNGTSGTQVSNISAGNYDITIVDNNNCQVTKTYTVTQPPALVLTENLSSHADLLCNGTSNGVIEVQATGGTGAYQYSINNGSWVSSPVFSGLAGNNYSLSVQDASACIYNMPQHITIAEPQPISLSTLTKSDGCHGMSNGTIAVTTTGGTGTLSYLLKLNGTLAGNISGTSTGNFTNLAPASGYTIEVNDANNCGPVISSSTDIIDPQAITLGTANNTNVSCNGRTDGVISVSASGGTSPFVYSLTINGVAVPNNSGVTSGNFTNVAPGTNYTVEVTDANQCGPVVSNGLDILEPSAIMIIKDSVQKATSNSPWNGSLAVVATGGTGILTYTLGGLSQDNGIFNALTPGNYTITVTDQNNCGPVSSSTLVVSDATDILMIKQGNLKVYPNPVQDVVTIDFGYSLSGTLQIEIVALDGKSFYKDHVSSTVNGKINLSLGSLPRGMYLLKINNEILKDKLILQ